MPHYFFHLRDDLEDFVDHEGLELPGPKAAEERALQGARDTLSNGIRDGLLDLRYRIDIEGADGTIIHSLRLEDSFEIIRQRSNGGRPS